MLEWGVSGVRPSRKDGRGTIGLYLLPEWRKKHPICMCVCVCVCVRVRLYIYTHTREGCQVNRERGGSRVWRWRCRIVGEGGQPEFEVCLRDGSAGDEKEAGDGVIRRADWSESRCLG